MRVLMTADTLGGVWTYAAQLCRCLAAHDVDVVLASLGREPSRSQRAELQHLPNLVLFPSSFRLEWMQDPWRDVDRCGDWLLEIESSTRPDLIHLNHLVHADLPWAAPVLSAGHSCVYSWWQAVHKSQPPCEWEEYRRRVGRSLRAADHVLAPSLFLLEQLYRFYGPFAHSSVIYNACDPDRFCRGHKEPLVFAAGRVWDRAKNLQTLATVAPRVNAEVCIAGEDRGPDGESVELAGVRRLGFLDGDELASWYSRAAIYAWPARYEPFGLTVLEAALSGCALVLGDTESLREVWGSAALYVDPDQPDELVEVLNELLADGRRRAELAERAGARAGELCSGRYVRQYLSLYRTVGFQRMHSCVS